MSQSKELIKGNRQGGSLGTCGLSGIEGIEETGTDQFAVLMKEGLR